jgi:MoaA/NifB/PqqE/SkfB family radical SAM enzyme
MPVLDSTTTTNPATPARQQRLLTWDKKVKSFFPGQVVIQFTDHCNARCPQCGMRRQNAFKRNCLRLPVLQSILNRAKAAGFSIVSFTGGEPLLHPELLISLLQYAGQLGMRFLRTGTNGFLFARSEDADYASRLEQTINNLAATPLRNFWISLDSCVPVFHERMRGLPGVVSGIRKALPLFHAQGLFPSANMFLNRNLGGDLTAQLFAEDFPDRAVYLQTFRSRYRIALERFFEHVLELGFTMCSICYPMAAPQTTSAEGLHPVYQAYSHDRIAIFTPEELTILFDLLYEIIPRFRRDLRIFTPRFTLRLLATRYRRSLPSFFPCLGGQRFLFVDAARGQVFPCGYREQESLGAADQIDWSDTFLPGDCTACDWECFRDPSDLLGPVWLGLTNPAALWQLWRQGDLPVRDWVGDLFYYAQTGFFNGRRRKF